MAQETTKTTIQKNPKRASGLAAKLARAEKARKPFAGEATMRGLLAILEAKGWQHTKLSAFVSIDGESSEIDAETYVDGKRAHHLWIVFKAIDGDVFAFDRRPDVLAGKDTPKVVGLDAVRALCEACVP